MLTTMVRYQDAIYPSFGSQRSVLCAMSRKPSVAKRASAHCNTLDTCNTLFITHSQDCYEVKFTFDDYRQSSDTPQPWDRLKFGQSSG